MQTLTTSELAFVAVLGHQELTIKALRLYADHRYLFSGMNDKHLELMWNRYMKLMSEARSSETRLTPDEIAAGLAEAVQASRMMPQDLKDKCDGILQKYLSGECPDLETGTDMIVRLTKMDSNRKMVAKLQQNAGIIELQSLMDATKKTMDGLKPSEVDEQDPGIMFSPLKDIDKLARHVERVPTGINWLDDVSSGGGRAGELWLILGPPGGGKSTIAVQYSCAQAMLSNNTLWVTYEQSLEGDLAERMIANITDTSLDVIRDVGFNRLPKEVQDRFWSSVAGVDDRLKALDMTKLKPDPSDPSDYGGIQTVWNQFKKLKEDGQAPKTVLIDWFGAMMSRIASNTGMDLSKCYRFKAQEEINLAIQFARQENILLIFFHQLDVEAASKRPAYLADATHAQDMHNMQNFFDLVFLIGTRDVNDICYFSSGKSRKGCRITRTLHLIGDKARFRMENGWQPNRDGNFYRPGATVTGQGNGLGASAASYSRELE